MVVLALLAGCATVRTDVLVIDPPHEYPPTTTVAVLTEPPPIPHRRIALLEARGAPGVSETGVLAALRERARALGADALVREAAVERYHPPVPVYEPYYDPFSPLWRLHPWRPHPFGPPYAPTPRLVGGGYSVTVKATALRYEAGTP